MAKARIHFLCNNCGAVQPKWMGKCPDCGTWDSLEEYKEPAFDERAERSGKLAAEAQRGGNASEPMAIAEIEEADFMRAAESIFDAAHDAMRMKAITLEINDGIDDMLDDLRPR